MPKTISLKQLAQKTYVLIIGLLHEIALCIGIPEDAFDCIIYGKSGNGKSSFLVVLLKALIKALQCKCEIVTYEEGHGLTVQRNFIKRHKALEELGNSIQLTDHYTFDELIQRMARKKSAKIWVIDSLQAARFTEEQCLYLRKTFVTSRKRKIIIYTSWSDGGLPKGAVAKAVEYWADIKLFVDKLVVFPKTRFEDDGIGNKNYVIWEPGAREKWGVDYDTKVLGLRKTRKAPAKKKAAKPKAEPPPKQPPPEPITQMQMFSEADKPVFKQALNDIENEN